MKYRILENGETIQPNDEIQNHDGEWLQVEYVTVGTRVFKGLWPIRRQH